MAVSEIVVIGGGVIGCAVARELAGARVTVLERGRVGEEASAAAAGMLGVQSEILDASLVPLAVESRALYPEMLRSLREETAIAVDFWADGGLFVSLREDDEREAEQLFARQRRFELPAEWLSAEQVRRLEPSLPRKLRRGLLLPRDARLDNRMLTRALAEAARRRGCSLREQAAVTSVVAANGQVDGVEIDGGERLACDVVINAAGAWAGCIRGAPPLPLTPVRGQMVALCAAACGFRRNIYSPRGYVVSRRHNRLLAGSTHETAGYEKQVTAGGLAGILRAALELSPQLAAQRVEEAWSGLRPATPDGLPLIGAHPALGGYFVAGGHYRNGILLAPATARALAALLRGECPAAIAPFRPDRFGQPAT